MDPCSLCMINSFSVYGKWVIGNLTTFYSVATLPLFMILNLQVQQKIFSGCHCNVYPPNIYILLECVSTKYVSRPPRLPFSCISVNFLSIAHQLRLPRCGICTSCFQRTSFFCRLVRALLCNFLASTVCTNSRNNLQLCRVHLYFVSAPPASPASSEKMHVRP